MVRALGASDGLAAVTVINAAAEWYAEFLPASEVSEPEMTLDGWAEEARRMTWYGAFDTGILVGVVGLEYGDPRRCPPFGAAVAGRVAAVRQTVVENAGPCG